MNLSFKINKYFAVSLAVLTTAVMFLNIDVSYAKSFDEAWKALMAEYRVIVGAVTGLGALTAILTFIFHFINLGKVANSPQERSKVLNNMLISGICTTLLGGIALISTIFFGLIFEPTEQAPAKKPPTTVSKPASEFPTDKYAPDDLTNGGKSGIA